MRPTAALACLLLLGAPAAGADEPLHVDGAALGPDGVLTRRIADVMGNDEPSHTPLLVIDEPPARSAGGRISGRVEAFEVDAEAWLELAAVFADGRREVARTLDRKGAGARLQGTAEPRRFELPVPRAGNGDRPVRLELGVGMLGPGVVSVSDLRLEEAVPAAAPAVPSAALGAGAAAALAAAAGVVALRRRRRSDRSHSV